MIRPASPSSRLGNLTLRSSLIVGAGLVVGCASHSTHALSSQETLPPAGQHPPTLPHFINDPLEPFNRGIWKFNEYALFGVVRPVSTAYRTIVPRPVRGSINDFTRNITYPGRAVNLALQGRWGGLKDESVRFLANTTVGVAGFNDVATKWNIPKANAGFSQTFGTWGWQPNTFLVLPMMGPSDDRHATGVVADAFAEPWNYKYPYRAASYVALGNSLADRAEDAALFLQTDRDSYTFAKYAWAYASKEEQPDWTLHGPVDLPTLETLGAVSVTCKDPEFGRKGREIAVQIPTTGRKLKANYWLQPGQAPLVYISPGLSSHRLSMVSLALAEHLYLNGFSVVTTTSVFHPEFMENASTADLPAYAPVDSKDLLVSLTEMDHALSAKFPNRLGKRALIGCSMGGFLTLRLAATEKSADPNLIRFDRYVAVNMPVNLKYGAGVVDSYQDAPREWPASTRQERLNNTLHKGAVVSRMPAGSLTAPPFDAVESKYIIGLSFRISLRDIIYSSQSRNNMGILHRPLSRWKREPSYEEIMTFSFRDYFVHFAAPYYKSRGVSLEALQREGNLRIHERALRNQPKLRVMTNRNDFLLTPADQAWLRSTFGPSRLTVFPQGGHLGNLSAPAVKDTIVHSLDGLK